MGKLRLPRSKVLAKVPPNRRHKDKRKSEKYKADRL